MTKMVREGWLIKLITVVVAMWERHKRCPQAARTQRRKGSFVLGNEFGTSRSMATVLYAENWPAPHRIER